MSCGLVCCGVKTVAVGDEFTAQALEYVKTSARGALVGQLFLIVLGAIAVLNFSVMGMALNAGIAGLSTMSATVAVTHSMLAGAMSASQNPRLAVLSTIVPVTAVGGIGEGILYAYMPAWQAVDFIGEISGFQVVGGALFTVTAFWLATVSAAIGWAMNRPAPRDDRRFGAAPDEERPLING